MNFLTKKIARGKLNKLIEPYKTEEMVLDLGSAKSPYSKWFPNRKSLDMDPNSGADIVADAHNIPLPDNSENFILCTEMLEHMYDPKQAVSEIYRILKPGGKVVLTTRFVYGIHEAPYDYFRFSKYALRHLFKDFNIINLQEDTSNFETLGALIQRLVYQSEFKGGKLTKLILLVLAQIFTKLNFLIKKQYTDIRKEAIETNIFANGYLIECVKPGNS